MNYTKIEDCLSQIRKKTDFVPKVAVVLGSGLGDFAEKIDVTAIVDYNEIDGFPVSTVSGHRGSFVFGYVGKTPVAAMQGRVHFYEGYEIDEVVLPIRLLKLLGAEILLLTNAAGGINPLMSAGDFMVIRDHISSFVPSPLRGENIDELGTRFPDMSHVYDEKLGDIINDTAHDLGINIKNGVYVQTRGPQYETPAEIRMYKMLGADAVGMSTACEAIAAVHAGLRVCGISCISNLAAGISPHPLTHDEIKETANRVGHQFKELVFNFLSVI